MRPIFRRGFVVPVLSLLAVRADLLRVDAYVLNTPTQALDAAAPRPRCVDVIVAYPEDMLLERDGNSNNWTLVTGAHLDIVKRVVVSILDSKQFCTRQSLWRIPYEVYSRYLYEEYGAAKRPYVTDPPTAFSKSPPTQFFAYLISRIESEGSLKPDALLMVSVAAGNKSFMLSFGRCCKSDTNVLGVELNLYDVVSQKVIDHRVDSHSRQKYVEDSRQGPVSGWRNFVISFEPLVQALERGKTKSINKFVDGAKVRKFTLSQTSKG